MASYTTGQAPINMQQVSAVPSAYQGDALELARAQRLAQMLSSSEPAQGQMISGRYVAPSWTQNLAQLANAATGAYFANKAETQQQALAKKIREGQNAALADYISQSEGRPPVEGGIYGADNRLTMQTTPDMFGPNMELNPQYRRVEARPAVPANPRAANLSAAQNELLPDWMRQFAIKEYTKGPKWKEISQYNDKTGNTETYRYDENASDPRSTLQFLGVSKPALSVSDRLTLTDRGIAIPNNLGGGGSGSGGGGPVVGNAPAGGQVNPAQPAVKPVSATNATSQDLIKTYGYDPFKLPVMPPQPSPEAAREWQKNAYKPLEGTAGQKVDGAKMYYNSLENYNNYVATLTPADLAKPSVRSRLDSLYATAKLTGKEANNLGVLNGGDERILEEVLPNYKNITVTKKNLDRIIQDQKQFASGIIVEAYGTQQKAVPENMRKFIVATKAEIAPITDVKEVRVILRQRNIPYKPNYEYKINPDGSIDERLKTK